MMKLNYLDAYYIYGNDTHGRRKKVIRPLNNQSLAIDYISTASHIRFGLTFQTLPDHNQY